MEDTFSVSLSIHSAIDLSTGRWWAASITGERIDMYGQSAQAAALCGCW